MFKNRFPVILTIAFLGGGAYAQQPPGPGLIQPSPIRVLAEYMGTAPADIGPGLIGGTSGLNIQSPVPIGDSLFFVDHIDGIHYAKMPGNGYKKIFSIKEGDAPEGLLFEIPELSDGKGGTKHYRQRQAVFNISPGSAPDKIYVTLVAVAGSTLPDVPRYTLPAPEGGPCCAIFSPPNGEIANLYDIKPEEVAPFFPLDFPYPGIEHQIIYEFTLKNQTKKLIDPRPIAIFDSQGGPLHHGAAMLTLPEPDGRILYVTGDAVPFGLSGLAAPQDVNSHLSKLLIVDPADGSAVVAASGLRNVQYMHIAESGGEEYLVFADIGGWTAEEVNAVPLADILDTAVVENLGWGVNADGKAREGTFYVATQPGEGLFGLGAVAFSFGTPDVVGPAPVPEPGFVQPHAQYKRPQNGDPLGGVASSGPAIFPQPGALTMVFSDLSSGILYGTTDPLDTVDAPVLALKILGEDGTEYDTFMDLLGLDPTAPGYRADPRFFQFPDGSAGVLLEKTGDYFRLTEM